MSPIERIEPGAAGQPIAAQRERKERNLQIPQERIDRARLVLDALLADKMARDYNPDNPNLVAVSTIVVGHPKYVLNEARSIAEQLRGDLHSVIAFDASTSDSEWSCRQIQFSTQADQEAPKQAYIQIVVYNP